MATAPTITSDEGSFSGYLALPPGGTGPGLILIQEIFGVNAGMRQIAEFWASQGYVAFVPDLFWRVEPGIELSPDVPEQLNRAFELYRGFSESKGVEDLRQALLALKAHEAVAATARDGHEARVGCLGFCLGGKLAYLMSTRTPVDAAVSYYGVGIEAALGEATAITKPLMLHIAEADGFVPPPAQAQIKEGLARVPLVTIHTYPGRDHAFARPDGMHFHADDAALAEARSVAFLAQALKG